VFGVAGTLLAAGVLGTLRRRRRRRAVTLPPGVAVPPPPPSAAELHAEAASAADEPAADRLDRILRHLAVAVAPQPGEPCPRPLVVQAGDHWVDVMVREPWPAAPPPWRAEAAGRVWHWDPPAGFEPPAPDPERWSPLPALVSAGGQDPDGSHLLVDVEAAGVVGLVGDPDAVHGLARSMILELACTPLAEAAAVLAVVDLDVPGVAALRHVRTGSTYAAVADELLTVARQTRESLDRLGYPTTFAARAAGNLDLAAPDLLVLGQPPEDERFAELCRLLADGQGGAAVVCVGWCPPDGFPIAVTGDRVQLPALGLAATAQRVTAHTAQAIAELVDSASAPAENVTEDPDPDAGQPPAANPAQGPDQLALLDAAPPPVPGLVVDSYQDRPYRLLVRLLAGPPTVVGGPHLTPKQTAVLAYATLHRSVTLDRLRDALWGGKAIAPKTVRSVLSDMRQVLPEGLISPLVDGRITVGQAAATDIELFERRASFARRQPPTEAATTLHAALELVSGTPFAYLARDDASYHWVDIENWGSRWEAKIVDAADRLATLCLAAGDGRGARWAAERGLAISPAHRQLTKQLIRAYGLLDQPEVAARVADEYERVTEDLGVDDSDDQPMRDVLADITRRRAAPVGGAGS
jgi:DNA-binding SARP family transcriptional activator